MLRGVLHNTKKTARLHGDTDFTPPTMETPKMRQLMGLVYKTHYGWHWNRTAIIMLAVSLLLTASILMFVLSGLWPIIGLLSSFPIVLTILVFLHLVWRHTSSE